MVVILKVGRRVPRNWFRRSITKARGLITFQENIWLIIDRALVMAKKKCAETPNGGIFIKRNYREVENINFDLEWQEIEYRGNPMQETEEYEEMQGLYKSIGQLFKAEIPKDDAFTKAFTTNRLTGDQLEKAYKAGYVNTESTTIAQRLLDMGIIIYMEKIEEKAPISENPQ